MKYYWFCYLKHYDANSAITVQNIDFFQKFFKDFQIGVLHIVEKMCKTRKLRNSVNNKSEVVNMRLFGENLPS